MPEIVRAALVQQAWTGDKESMTAAAVAHIATAASAGAQVVCLQELFYGPYFCQVQDADYYSYTEAIPDGPTTKLMQDIARQHVLAGRVDDLRPARCGSRARLDDRGDPLALHHHVGAHGAGRRHDGSAGDQDGHGWISAP